MGGFITAAVKGLVGALLAPITALFARKQDRRDGATDLSNTEKTVQLKQAAEGRRIDVANDVTRDRAAVLDKLRAQREAAARHQ